MRFRLECVPAFNYGRDSHTVEIIARRRSLPFTQSAPGLASSIPLQNFSTNGVAGEFSLDEGQSQSFELHGLQPGVREQIGLPEHMSEQLFRDTIHYWRQWICQVYLPRPLARNGSSLGSGAETAYLRAHRRHRRRPHLQSA